MKERLTHHLDRDPSFPNRVKLGEGKLAPGGYKIAHLTGTGRLKLTEAQRAELKDFIKRGGGTLIVDAVGGNGEFAETVENELRLIAIPSSKAQESGVVAAAAARRIPIVLIAQPALEAVSEFVITRSARALAAMNVNSVAEAAALAGAGAHSRLLGPRVAVGPVTCALAEGDIQQ